jgi:hypothetical protein
MEPDYTPPIFSNVSVKSGNFQVGDNITASMNVFDLESGVRYVECYAYDLNTWWGRYFGLDLVSGDNLNGLYSVTIPFNRVGSYSGYCYAYNNFWSSDWVGDYYFNVFNATEAPTFRPTPVPTPPPMRRRIQRQ